MIPFTGPRARYSLVGMQPTWIFHTASVAGVLDGQRPATVTKPDPNDLDPTTVKGGFAEYADLEHGGLFHEIGQIGKAVLITGFTKAPAGAVTSAVTVSYASGSEVQLRDVLAKLTATPFEPFTLAPNEYLKIVGTTKSVGVLVNVCNPDDGVF